MKYLVVILVVVIVGWLALRGRSQPKVAQRRQAPKARQAEAIVACRHCGIHVPRAESVEDGSGFYCSEAHRLAGPKSPG
jgi:uncharacterized protein